MRNYLHQSYLLVFMSVGIILGTILALVLRINFFAATGWAVLVIILFIYAYLKPTYAFGIIIFVAGMILAFFRVAIELKGENYIRQLYVQTILVTGTVSGDPETDEGGTSIKLTDLKFGEEGISARGSLYISARQNEEIERGDTVSLYGKLASGFGTYAGYMYRPTIKAILKPEPGDLILKIRNWFSGRIRELIPEPEVLLGLSYLLGMKAGLPEDLNENLRVVGLVHIVVASGAHLSILVGIARKIFGKVSRMAGLIFSVLFVLFFMAMVGFTPSILRAGVMSILSLIAWYVGRKFAAWRIILLVAALTLMINPSFIINLGWLLSFASFAGIMILGPRITKFFYGIKKPGFFGSTIITTISATLMTLPITLYFYGQISLISVLANLLILPTLSYAMGLVFLTGVVFGIPLIQDLVAFLATKLLDFHILVVEFFGGMKSFLIQIPPYQILVFLIYIVILVPLIFLVVRERKRDKIKA